MVDVAKRAALKAGSLILSLRNEKRLGSSKQKGRVGDFATEADLASEKTILEILQKSFPKHSFWTEEAGRVDNGSEFCWVIDPIDGTLQYSLGTPFFGVSIGLLKNGKPFLGVLNFPELKRLYWAKRGMGAFLNNQKISVSRERNLGNVLVGFDFSWIGERNEINEIESVLKPIAEKVIYTPIYCCSILSLALVAEGGLGGYVHRGYLWDFVAGAALVDEAGGKVTDNKGKPVNWLAPTMSIVASNGHIHNQILSSI